MSHNSSSQSSTSDRSRSRNVRAVRNSMSGAATAHKAAEYNSGARNPGIYSSSSAGWFNANSGLPNTNSRMNKVNEILHRDLAKIISLECKDPRLGMVTVTAVEVTKDLSNAKVFVTVLEEDKTEQSLKILNSAAGFLRSRLSQLIKLRKMPALHFIYDQSVITGSRINSIFTQIETQIENSGTKAERTY